MNKPTILLFHPGAVCLPAFPSAANAATERDGELFFHLKEVPWPLAT